MKLLKITLLSVSLCSLQLHAMGINQEEQAAELVTRLAQQYQNPDDATLYQNYLATLGIAQLEQEEQTYKNYLSTMQLLPAHQRNDIFNKTYYDTQTKIYAIQAARYNVEIPFMNPGYRNSFTEMNLEQLRQEEAKLKAEQSTIVQMPGDKRQQFARINQEITSLLADLKQAQYTKMSFFKRHPKLIIFGGIGIAAALCYFAYQHFNSEKPEDDTMPDSHHTKHLIEQAV